MKPLKAHNIIDIIAPAGKVHLPAVFDEIEQILQTWGYQARFGKNILGNHSFLSHTLEKRFEDLVQALYAEDSNIIWCYRGGNGSSELLPLLDTLTPPSSSRIFLSFSDATSLHIYFNQRWGWTTFHGPGAKQIVGDKIDNISLNHIQQLFKNQLDSPLNYHLKAVNKISEKTAEISGIITGGNLSIIAHSLGTPYQIQTDHKILLLEDVNEPAYKIRRMLIHLSQANIFKNIKALILGEFINPDLLEKQWIEHELQEFANLQSFPVFQTDKIGHGKTNYVVPLGSCVSLLNAHIICA